MHMIGTKTLAIACMIAATGLWLSGCSSEPLPPTEPRQLDPATAKADYWLAKPAAAIVYGEDYDQLWDACADVARADLYSLDRQDYRDGLLTTTPMISKQIWEFWRNDAGDSYDAMQDTLQTIRRTVRFEFDRGSGGNTVTPKVLVERFAQPNNRITSTGEYRGYFATTDEPSSMRSPYSTSSEDYWYAIGRDYAMEAELAKAIKAKLAPQEP